MYEVLFLKAQLSKCNQDKLWPLFWLLYQFCRAAEIPIPVKWTWLVLIGVFCPFLLLLVYLSLSVFAHPAQLYIPHPSWYKIARMTMKMWEQAVQPIRPLSLPTIGGGCRRGPRVCESERALMCTRGIVLLPTDMFRAAQSGNRSWFHGAFLCFRGHIQINYIKIYFFKGEICYPKWFTTCLCVWWKTCISPVCLFVCLLLYARYM